MSIIRFRCPEAAGGSYSPSLMTTVPDITQHSNVASLLKPKDYRGKLAVQERLLEVSYFQTIPYG
jgi:hypothetical protein